ncbi:unnamed protein product, partial [Closterium sp. NIES-65]
MQTSTPSYAASSCSLFSTLPPSPPPPGDRGGQVRHHAPLLHPSCSMCVDLTPLPLPPFPPAPPAPPPPPPTHPSLSGDRGGQVIEADKYAIMRRCAIPARDLRILDPLLSYPSTLLGREQAIVVNLEHIKCIIMGEEVLLLNQLLCPPHPAYTTFHPPYIRSHPYPIPFRSLLSAWLSSYPFHSTPECIIMAEEVLLLNWRNFQVARVVEELKARLPLHLNAAGQQVARVEEELKSRLPLHFNATGQQVCVWWGQQARERHITSHDGLRWRGWWSGVEDLKARLPLHLHTAGHQSACGTLDAEVSLRDGVRAEVWVERNGCAAAVTRAQRVAFESRALEVCLDWSLPVGPSTLRGAGAGGGIPPPAPSLDELIASFPHSCTVHPFHRFCSPPSPPWPPDHSSGAGSITSSRRAHGVIPPFVHLFLLSLPHSSRQTTRVEQEAYPALDELTASVSTLNLERVRQIKSRLVVISGRVQKVRDELEQLLDDDEDRDEMYVPHSQTSCYCVAPASSYPLYQQLGVELEHLLDNNEDRDEMYVPHSQTSCYCVAPASSYPLYQQLGVELEHLLDNNEDRDEMPSQTSCCTVFPYFLRTLYWQMRDELEQLLDDDEDMDEMCLTGKLLQHLPCFTLSPTPSHPLYWQVRDELEQLLDDDEDMDEMYLTDKLLQQRQAAAEQQQEEEEMREEEERQRLLLLQQHQHVHGRAEDKFSFGVPSHSGSSARGEKRGGGVSEREKKCPSSGSASPPGLDDIPPDGDGSEGAGSEGAGSEDAGSEGVGSEGVGSEGAGSESTGSDGAGSDGHEPLLLAIGRHDHASSGSQRRPPSSSQHSNPTVHSSLSHFSPTGPSPSLPRLSNSSASGRSHSHSHSHSHSRGHSHSRSHAQHPDHHRHSSHSLPSVAEHGPGVGSVGSLPGVIGGEVMGLVEWDVEELKMLLEAYFVQIEGTLNKLSSMSHPSVARGSGLEATEHYINNIFLYTPPYHTLREYVEDTEDKHNAGREAEQSAADERAAHHRHSLHLLPPYTTPLSTPLYSSLREYVEDTEDYINIMLDEKQNSLLQMNVLLTTATLFISFFIVVTGVFGMNIDCSYFDPENPANYSVFYYVVIGSTVACITSFILAVVYMPTNGSRNPRISRISPVSPSCRDSARSPPSASILRGSASASAAAPASLLNLAEVSAQLPGDLSGYMERVRECNAGLVGGGWERGKRGETGDVFVIRSTGGTTAAGGRVLSFSGRLEAAGAAERTEAVAGVLQRLREQGVVTGWRNELYPVGASFYAPPAFLIERAAAPLFGTKAYGVHMNGYTHLPSSSSSSSLHLWVARRSPLKPTFPNQLDHLVAGGQPHGISCRDNMIKECEEEADIPRHLAERAVPVGVVSYETVTAANTLKRDVLFCYDLLLPPDFTPRNT